MNKKSLGGEKKLLDPQPESPYILGIERQTEGTPKMKTVKANPDLIDLAHAWAVANPAEAFVAATIILLSVCYKFRHAF